MIQAKPGQVVLERRKDPPVAPVAEQTELARLGALPGLTLADLVTAWSDEAPGPTDMVSRIAKWEVFTPEQKLLGWVRAPDAENARALARRGFKAEAEATEDGVGLLVRYAGTSVAIVRKVVRS